MNTKSASIISKVGQRRQVVIPKEIFEELGLVEGGFVEVSREQGTVVIKPKQLVDADIHLISSEAKTVRRGLKEIANKKIKPWQQVKDGLGN